MRVLNPNRGRSTLLIRTVQSVSNAPMSLSYDATLPTS